MTWQKNNLCYTNLINLKNYSTVGKSSSNRRITWFLTGCLLG